jgi:hypothetical protein
LRTNPIAKVIGSTIGLDPKIEVGKVDPTTLIDLVQLGPSLDIGFKENLGPIHLGWPKVLMPNLFHEG